MVNRRFCPRRYQIVAVIFSCATYCFLLYLQKEPSLEATRLHIEKKLVEALKEDKGTGCELPDLDPFAKEVTEFETEAPKLTCGGLDWVKCYFSTCRVVPAILNSMHNIICVYRDIIYESDLTYYLGPSTVFRDSNPYTLTKSDHVRITCNGTPRASFTSSKWKGYCAGFRTTVKIKPIPPDRKDSYNILIFGFDSTSKNGFIRKMPRSYKYLTQVVNGTILHGYNILGDGTPPTLFPILTGKTELELPEVRKKMTNNTLDLMPFIFYKVRDYGYRTAYFEDLPWIGTFQYRFNGFLRQPTDYYLRAFYLEERQGNWWQRIQHEYCLGDTPQFKFMMNITEQILQLDGKKFIFTFISDITHDNFDIITSADDDMVSFLRSLVKMGVLEDTLVIIMGDHGQRYAGIRNTFQGKLEERLPLMCILLPNKLRRRRPEVQLALKANANVLTSPHDIHATMLDVLDMKKDMNPYKVAGAHLPRALSLLQPIPRNRSCSEAGIEAHWCACLVWHNISETNDMFKKVANAFVDYVNHLTEGVRSDCAFRSLNEIKWVMQRRANGQMLSFVQSKNEDGYFGKFGAKIKHAIEYYHIRVILRPGQAVYEASMKYIVDDDKFLLDSRDISRTNKYSQESICMSDKLPHLYPYCYCVDIMTPEVWD